MQFLKPIICPLESRVSLYAPFCHKDDKYMALSGLNQNDILCSFHRRDNEEQTSFNAKVDEALVQAESDLAFVVANSMLTFALQRMKKVIQQGWSHTCRRTPETNLAHQPLQAQLGFWPKIEMMRRRLRRQKRRPRGRQESILYTRIKEVFINKATSVTGPQGKVWVSWVAVLMRYHCIILAK